jgi:hypothetical protein
MATMITWRENLVQQKITVIQITFYRVYIGPRGAPGPSYYPSFEIKRTLSVFLGGYYRFGVVASTYAFLVSYAPAMNHVLIPFSHPCYNAVQRWGARNYRANPGSMGIKLGTKLKRLEADMQ